MLFNNTLITKPQPISAPSVLNHNLLVLINLSLISLSAIALTACDTKPQYSQIEGETMGTSYHISYQRPKTADKVSDKMIKQAIDARLVAINDSMSTYQDDSTISTFNSLPANTPLSVDKDFINVLTDAKQVYNLSDGAFNPTVMPLVELWGFGHKMTVEQLQNPPSKDEIAQAKDLIDFDSINLIDNTLIKDKEGVAVDFSAIAKGYGVDVIAQTLQDDYQINNYMVEIGGEVATSGSNAKGQSWKIAIDAPIINSSVATRKTIAVIRQPKQPNNLHLATSGNYRNSIVFDGVRYSHTIDPLTGSPIVGGASSVTVAAESVALADAWATALTAMPYPKALNMAEKHKLAVMFIVSKPQHEVSGTQAIDTVDSLDNWQIVETTAMQALRADSVE